MNNDIKEILDKIASINPKAFEDFSSSHPLCFQPKKGNWLFPMMFDYYVNTIKDETITNLMIELGTKLHNSCRDIHMAEITHIDRSLCIDDSYVEDYVIKIQKAHNKDPKFIDLNSPWRTRGINLSLYEIPISLLNSIIFEYKDKEHPYILADIAGIYIYSQRFTEALNYLYRSVELLIHFPNRFWNSDYGIVGAVNTFRLLLLMCPLSDLNLYRKLFAYDYMYLTKLACTTEDDVFQQDAYVNRASIVMNPIAKTVLPIHINPGLLYISDMYYAHYCNELAESISYSSGWKYNMKSLTYYQNGSIKPNGSGGYVDTEEKTYNEIVSDKHKQAIQIAYHFYLRILEGCDALESEEIESLFRLIQYELRYNFKSIRNRVLNYKKYN